MYRNEVRLITVTDAREINKVITEQCEGEIWFEDGAGSRVNARSFLGSLLTLEWCHIYVVSQKDISGKLIKWII